MRAPLRSTNILKSIYSRPPRLSHSLPIICRRGLLISSPFADAHGIVVSDPVPNTSAASPGLLGIRNENCVLTYLKMQNLKSLALRSLSSRSPSQPLKISILGKVRWLESEGKLRMYTFVQFLKSSVHAENEIGSLNSLIAGAVSKSLVSNTISIPENIIYDTHHSTHIYQIISYLNDNCQSRWNAGLDDYRKRSSSLDWAYALNQAYTEREDGENER